MLVTLLFPGYKDGEDVGGRNGKIGPQHLNLVTNIFRFPNPSPTLM